MVFFLKFILRAGVSQLSGTVWIIRLHLHSELPGVCFTHHPLLDKIAENDSTFCCCRCVSELVQGQRRDLSSWVIVPCGTVPLCHILSQNLWKDPSVSQFSS